MKIIRSFLIVAAALGASTLLHAQTQDLKTEIAKPVASTVPPPGSKPVLAPDIKPESKNITLQQSEETVTPVPLPSTRKEEPVKAPLLKSTGIITDEKPVITQPVMLPNDQQAKPLPITSPAVPKAKENQ